MAPSVSIVIPTHNRPEMALAAAMSVREQSYPDDDLECVIVDSSTEENRVKLSQSLGERCPGEWLHVESLRRDPGLLACWYIGVAVARGEYVTILPDDDWLEPTFVERCVGMMAQDVALVITEGMVRWGGKRIDACNLQWPVESGHVPSAGVIEALLSMPLTITPACQMMRRGDVLDCLCISQPAKAAYRSRYQEAYMTLSILNLRPMAGWIADPLVNLAAHDGSITIDAMADARKYEQLVKDYRVTKDAWLKVHS